MPVLHVGDEYTIGQSAAINYYAAAVSGLLGDSHLEAAQILSVQEHLKEMNMAYKSIVPYGVRPTEEQLTKWFDSGATDVSGIADASSRSSRYMNWYMGRIEAALGPNEGFAVGSKISLADVLLYNALFDHLKKEEMGSEVEDFEAVPFGSKERTDKSIALHPKVAACIQTVANNANIKKWLSTRGVQGF
jgi:glutathione S-transferase